MSGIGRFMLGVLAGLAIVAAGCDRRPTPAPPTSTPEEPAATQPGEAARPTTRELVSGPYKTIPLPGMPLTIRAPESWKINAVGTVVFLEGPTPSDKASIQLSQRDTISPERVEMLAEAAKKEMEQHRDTVKRAELHDLGNMKVLERISFTRPITTPKVDARGNGILDEKGEIVTETLRPVRWTLTVFIPYEKAFSQYELNFIDLTAEQYAVDQSFLEKIVQSLAYEKPATQP